MKPIPINRSLPVKCPSCGKASPIPLFLQAEDQPVDCPECGANMCTMGGLIDLSVKRAAEALGAGLERRVRRP